MLFRSVLLATLRPQIRPALAWGIALALFTIFTMWTNWTREYPTEDARQRLAQQVESGGFAFVEVVYGPAHQIERFDGHVEWRLGLYPLLLGLFMVLATTASTRGTEESGELDLLLSVPRSRRRVLAERGAGLALALSIACVLVWLSVLASGPIAGEPVVPLGRSFLAVLNFALAAAMFAAISMLLSQFFRSRRAAATAAGALLVASHIWANLGLVSESLEGWRWFSPLYLYAQSSPLATGEVSVAALVSTALITLACGVAAAWLFDKRDLQTAVRIPLLHPLASRISLKQYVGNRSWLLGNGFQRAFGATLGSAWVWGIGLAILAMLITAATPSFREGLAGLPEAQEAAQNLDLDVTSDTGILSSLLFLLLPLLVALFAAAVASAFAGEEQQGRLELELTLPVSRQRYFFWRAGAAIAALVVTVGVTAVGFALTAGLMDLDLDWDMAWAALALLILPAAVILSFGLAVGALKPAAVSGVLAAALAASFFFDLLAPALDIPDELRKLSVFQLYGNPLVQGVQWLDVSLLATLILAFLGAGVAVFTRRDVLK